jgi:hypothetical protein
MDKKTTLTILVVAVVIAIFLYYRWKVFGKGNRNLAHPTTFGWPPYDKKSLAKAGLVQSGPFTLEKKVK